MEFIDQLKRKILLPDYPKRIVSIVPSQTELLYDLGLEEEVIGITKFCIHPERWFRNKTRIGGTKKLDIAKIRSLKPDIVFANKEENEKSQVRDLEVFVPVWISDIHTLHDAMNMIRQVGEITDKNNTADELCIDIKTGFEQLETISKPIRTLYLIWYEPYMGAGADTFIFDMMQRAGFVSVLDENRYPVLNESKIKALNPELVLLSSEPYPFKEKHVQELQRILPSAKVALVDGEMFSWYGSRLKKASGYFNSLVLSLNS